MTKQIIIAAAVITVLLLGYFYWQLKLLQQQSPPTTPLSANVVAITHAFKGGVHRYAGELTLPHSCFSTTVDVITDPIDPTNLVLSIETMDNILTERFCVQILTRYPFETTVNAPPNASIILRVNGINTPISVIETIWQERQATPKSTVPNTNNL